MDNIKGILNNVVQKIFQAKTGQQNSLRQVFEKNLKEDEKENVKFEGERQGILYVKVGSSAWLYQMNVKKRSLLEKICQDSPEITDIKFTIGTLNG